MDPDPGGPKTCRSGGSGFGYGTLCKTLLVPLTDLDLLELEVVEVGHEGHDLGLAQELEEGGEGLGAGLPHPALRVSQRLQQGRHVTLRHLHRGGVHTSCHWVIIIPR